MSNEAQSEDVIRFHLTFSVDRDKFFRRSCPSCGRDFKTQVDEADLVASLQPAFRQMGLDIGTEHSEEREETQEHLYCPYCEHRAKSSDMLTQTFISYLKRYVMREYILPRVNKVFSNAADAFRGTGRGSSKGLFSIEAIFEHNRPVLPPRPISGPEPPDMTIVDLLCCGKKIKILDGWYDLNLCPYCGTRVLLQ
jgi:DNA-directed RNA polymerase subunit RPC12/RpoP